LAQAPAPIRSTPINPPLITRMVFMVSRVLLKGSSDFWPPLPIDLARNPVNRSGHRRNF
jgi:hypothetical protein